MLWRRTTRASTEERFELMGLLVVMLGLVLLNMTGCRSRDEFKRLALLEGDGVSCDHGCAWSHDDHRVF